MAPSRHTSARVGCSSCRAFKTKCGGQSKDGAKVCGANLAFRRDALNAVGGFRNELGRIGQCLIGGEETLAVRLIVRSGLDVIYDPSVRVKHRIPRERLALEWIRKRAYWEGVTLAAMVKATGEAFPRSLGIPKLLASAALFGALYPFTRNPDHLIRWQIAIGALTTRLKPVTPPTPLPISQAKAHAGK